MAHHCVLTLEQGGYEGCGHAAGTQQHSMAHLELPLRDPAQHHRCDSSQEPHHGGLHLGGEETGIGNWECGLQLDEEQGETDLLQGQVSYDEVPLFYGRVHLPNVDLGETVKEKKLDKRY